MLLGHDDARGFAAELLMPAKHLRGTHHRHWHVDRETFATRAQALGISPVPTMHSGMARRETSRLLTKVFKALRENGTTPHQVARELTLGLEELNGLVFGLVLTALPGGGERGPVRRARLTLVH